MKTKKKNKRKRMSNALNMSVADNSTESVSTSQFHVKNQNYKKVLPNEIKVGFDEVFGHKECKREMKSLLQFLKDPSLYHARNVKPHTKYLLLGPSGIGKKTFICSLAKEANLPILIIEPTFFSVDDDEFDQELQNLFTEAAILTAQHQNCMMLFKNIEYWMSEETKVAMFYIEKLLGHFKVLPEIIVFATLSSNLGIPRIFLENDGFTKIIKLQEPNVTIREEVLSYFLNGVPLEKDFDIHKLAVDIFGMSIKNIKDFVRNTLLFSVNVQSDVVTYQHFAEVLAETEFGYKNSKPTEETRIHTARHEAGHVVADYFTKLENCTISKVDITPRSVYGGITITNFEENKSFLFKEDLEKEIISDFGGMAAEEFYYKTTSSGVSSDLRSATTHAVAYYKLYGMSKDFGPVSLDPEVIVSDVLDAEADKAIREFLKLKYNETLELITKHSDKLEELVQLLLEKEVLYREEILELLKSPSATTLENSSPSIWAKWKNFFLKN